MKKIYLYVVIVLLFVIEQLFAYDFTINDVNGNAIYYNYLGGDSVAITYDKMLQSSYAGDIVIPSNVFVELSTYRITSIGNYAFCGGALTSIIIPNSVTNIGKSAFYGCNKLISIEIPESVTSIGETAFGYCRSLTSIDLPNSITNIAKYTFLNCTGLTSVTIPNSVISIGISAFDGCHKLSSLSVPGNVSDIGEYAFQSCFHLDSIVVPNSVTSIGDNAFLYVRNIVYNGEATGSPWGAKSINGCAEGPLVYADKNKQILLACSVTATDVVIPESVTEIGPNAFYHCESLSSIDIPNSVTSIGENAFFVCSSLTSVTIPKSVASIGNTVFSSCSNLTSICVEVGNAKYDSREHCNALVETASNTLIEGCKNTTIPNSITSIGERAFYGCTGLTSVIIPNSVTSIGDNAFNGCSALDTVICKAIVPPMPGTLPFGSISPTAVLFVPYESIDAYKAISEYVSKFYVIEGFSFVEDITEESAVLKWIPDTAVTQYKIDVYQNTTHIAHYEVDGNGHVISGPSGLPSIYRQKMDTTTSSTDYFVISLGGLSAGTDYNYTIDGTNAQNMSVYHEEGSFTTQSEPVPGLGITETPDDPRRARKILRNGHVFIVRDGKIYTLHGIRIDE